MTAAAPAVGPTTRSLRTSLAVLGLVIAAAALVDLVLLEQGQVADLEVLSLFLVDAVLWSGAGLLAWSRRPNNRTGLLLVCGGCSFLVAALSNTTMRPLVIAGALASTLPLALLVHVSLAFPSGRVRGRAARLIVVAAYATALLGPLPGLLFTPGSPLEVADEPGLADLSRVVEPAGLVVSALTAAVLLRRLRRASSRERRTLGPLYLYGVLSALGLNFAVRLRDLFGASAVEVFVVQSLVLAVLPVAFVSVLLLGGFRRTQAVEELSTMLSTEEAPTQDVLARVLGDPSLELLHWLPAEGTWVDSDGRPRQAEVTPGRGLVEVTVGQERAGALTYDAALLPDPELVRLAARPAGLALQAERLSVELRRSRARLVAAADDERQRLARDLHDGLQVRLVLLALEAGTLASTADDEEVGRALRRLRQDIDGAAEELRRVVQSLLPAALVERGLGPAVEDLVDRLPLPVDLALDVPGDLPPALVTTAWYVLTEAVTNALKHAQADALKVELTAGGGRLLIDVSDDGVGGARLDSGTGLSGLVDRLDVVGGALHLDSPSGRGTRVCAEIPARL